MANIMIQKEKSDIAQLLKDIDKNIQEKKYQGAEKSIDALEGRITALNSAKDSSRFKTALDKLRDQLNEHKKNDAVTVSPALVHQPSQTAITEASVKIDSPPVEPTISQTTAPVTVLPPVIASISESAPGTMTEPETATSELPLFSNKDSDEAINFLNSSAGKNSVSAITQNIFNFDNVVNLIKALNKREKPVKNDMITDSDLMIGDVLTDTAIDKMRSGELKIDDLISQVENRATSEILDIVNSPETNQNIGQSSYSISERLSDTELTASQKNDRKKVIDLRKVKIETDIKEIEERINSHGVEGAASKEKDPEYYQSSIGYLEYLIPSLASSFRTLEKTFPEDKDKNAAVMSKYNTELETLKDRVRHLETAPAKEEIGTAIEKMQMQLSNYNLASTTFEGQDYQSSIKHLENLISYLTDTFNAYKRSFADTKGDNQKNDMILLQYKTELEQLKGQLKRLETVDAIEQPIKTVNAIKRQMSLAIEKTQEMISSHKLDDAGESISELGRMRETLDTAFKDHQNIFPNKNDNGNVLATYDLEIKALQTLYSIQMNEDEIQNIEDEIQNIEDEIQNIIYKTEQFIKNKAWDDAKDSLDDVKESIGKLASIISENDPSKYNKDLKILEESVKTLEDDLNRKELSSMQDKIKKDIEETKANIINFELDDSKKLIESIKADIDKFNKFKTIYLDEKIKEASNLPTKYGLIKMSKDPGEMSAEVLNDSLKGKPCFALFDSTVYYIDKNGNKTASKTKVSSNSEFSKIFSSSADTVKEALTGDLEKIKSLKDLEVLTTETCSILEIEKAYHRDKEIEGYKAEVDKLAEDERLLRKDVDDTLVALKQINKDKPDEEKKTLEGLISTLERIQNASIEKKDIWLKYAKIIVKASEISSDLKEKNKTQNNHRITDFIKELDSNITNLCKANTLNDIKANTAGLGGLLQKSEEQFKNETGFWSFIPNILNVLYTAVMDLYEYCTATKCDRENWTSKPTTLVIFEAAVYEKNEKNSVKTSLLKEQLNAMRDANIEDNTLPKPGKK